MNACWKLRVGGETGVAVAAPGKKPAERRTGTSGILRRKAFRAHNRAVLAHCDENGSSVLRQTRASVRGRCSATGNVSVPSVRLVRCRTSAYGSPVRRICERPLGERAVWAVAGACGAQLQHHLGSGPFGNGNLASKWIASCPARASARVTGRRVKPRSEVRKHHARESEDSWVLVTSSRLQRSHEGYLCPRARRAQV